MKNSADYKIKKTPLLLKPYFYSRPSISATSIKLLSLLFLQYVMLFLTKSFSAVFVVSTCVVSSALSGLLVYLYRKSQPFLLISIIVQGFLIGLLLPETFPLHAAFLITFIVIILEQYLFVNCINCWINIVALVVVACYFIGKQYFPDFAITRDLLSVKNPSLYLVQSGAFATGTFDTAVTDFLNNSVFGWFNVTVPGGLISLLVDNGCAIPAFRFNLLTILSSIVIFSDGSFSKTIPFCFILTYGILVRLFCPMINGGAFNDGDIILAVYTSGTMFTAVFLLQWFGTNPITYPGKYIYGILSGVAAFFIVGCGTSPIGMSYTILVCNIINLFIREVEEILNEKRLNKMLASVETAN